MVTGPAHGTLAFNADGSFVYTSTALFVGLDTFTYHDTDSTGAVGNTATVTINVLNFDIPPKPSYRTGGEYNTRRHDGQGHAVWWGRTPTAVFNGTAPETDLQHRGRFGDEWNRRAGGCQRRSDRSHSGSVDRPTGCLQHDRSLRLHTHAELRHQPGWRPIRRSPVRWTGDVPIRAERQPQVQPAEDGVGQRDPGQRRFSTR